MTLIADDDREPTAEELAAIEKGEDPFADPEWAADTEVDIGDYLGAEYDAFDLYDNEYDVP
jgi:hypothetical protein